MFSEDYCLADNGVVLENGDGMDLHRNVHKSAEIVLHPRPLIVSLVDIHKCLCMNLSVPQFFLLRLLSFWCMQEYHAHLL